MLAIEPVFGLRDEERLVRLPMELEHREQTVRVVGVDAPIGENMDDQDRGPHRARLVGRRDLDELVPLGLEAADGLLEQGEGFFRNR
ncbi:MAG: hypothetical protein R3F35_20125 [Myxococcota bacterium]